MQPVAATKHIGAERLYVAYGRKCPLSDALLPFKGSCILSASLSFVIFFNRLPETTFSYKLISQQTDHTVPAFCETDSVGSCACRSCFSLSSMPLKLSVEMDLVAAEPFQLVGIEGLAQSLISDQVDGSSSSSISSGLRVSMSSHLACRPGE
jgi:hypothetical protein